MTRSLSALAALLAASAPAAAADPPRPPNVLFCIADDASSHFGAYGCKWTKTPNVDRVAAAGVVFENAYTPTAKCAPSRAAILTGRYPWLLEEAANHQPYFPAKYKAFTEALAEAGVSCGSAGKVWGPGSATTADGKVRTWGMTHTGGAKAGPPGDRFKQFLAARPKDRPFFYWYGSTNPHRPYTADAGLAAGKKPADVDRVPAIWPDNDTVRRDMLDYATEVEAFDAEVGSLLKALADAGEAENTVVIVTSDHGMPFPRVKGHNYDASNRVPLVVGGPKAVVAGGRRVADFVNFVDLAPTLLELYAVDGAKAGLAAPSGHSFTDLLRGKAARERPVVVTGRERNDAYARPGTEAGLGYPVRAVREGDFLYVHNFAPDRWPCGNPDLGLKDTDAGPTKKLVEDRGEKDAFWQLCFGKRPAEELFDLAKDPDCVANLAADARHRDRAAALREKLFAELKRQGDPRALGKGDVFDNYPTFRKK
ncbi:MAG: heparan N-sulfatase [Isosphaera sp.]|nr:heparan N-sulfatase [Isosphaera sp.]